MTWHRSPVPTDLSRVLTRTTAPPPDNARARHRHRHPATALYLRWQVPHRGRARLAPSLLRPALLHASADSEVNRRRRDAPGTRPAGRPARRRQADEPGCTPTPGDPRSPLRDRASERLISEYRAYWTCSAQQFLREKLKVTHRLVSCVYNPARWMER